MLLLKQEQTKGIVKQLKANRPVIVETDTVMGIICTDYAQIYHIKQRDPNKKLITFIYKIKQVPNLSKKEKLVLKKYWPGKLTIIKDGISYRMPNHPLLRKLLKKVKAVFSSSANISGQTPIANSAEAEKIFSTMQNLVIVEGKDLTTTPSTIVCLDDYSVKRHGEINGDEIIKKLKENN